MADSIFVRPATQADGEGMAVFLSALSAEAPDTISRRPAPTADEESAFVRRAEEAERAFVLLALDSCEVVGLLDLWAGRGPHIRHSAAFGMSVAKTRRNQGIGRRLLGAAMRQALSWDGFCRLELEVAAWNAPAIRLYEGCGFGVEGRRVKSLNLRGTAEDALLMARTW